MAISTELLQRFCACPHNDARQALHRPWWADDRIYAANGWVLISIPYDGRELHPPLDMAAALALITAGIALPAAGAALCAVAIGAVLAWCGRGAR